MTQSIKIDSKEEEEEGNKEDSNNNNRDQDYEQPGARSFFQTQCLTTDRHHLLVDFYDYLGMVVEGQKAKKIHFQHA